MESSRVEAGSADIPPASRNRCSIPRLLALQLAHLELLHLVSDPVERFGEHVVLRQSVLRLVGDVGEGTRGARRLERGVLAGDGG